MSEPTMQPEQDAENEMLSPAAAPKKIPIWRLLGTVLSLGLLVYLIRAQGWNEFADVFRRLPLTSFLLALVFSLGSRMCVSLRWYVLLRYARINIKFWQSIRLTFMGLFASNFLPSTVGGDLVRLAGAIYLHIDAGVSAASLVVDRLIGMAGMSLLAPFGLAIVFSQPGNASSMLRDLQLSGGLFVGLQKIPGVSWLTRKVRKFVHSVLLSSGYWLRNPAGLFLALACTLGHMTFTFLSIYVLLHGMGQGISFGWIGALWSLNYFITTLVPISINGLGLQEVSVTYLYSHFGGVSTEAGLALALLVRLLPMLASLPGALFLPDILRPMPPTTRAKED